MFPPRNKFSPFPRPFPFAGDSASPAEMHAPSKVRHAEHSRGIFAPIGDLQRNLCQESCCGARRMSSVTKHLRPSSTTATRSPRCICHWQRSDRSLSTTLRSARDDAVFAGGKNLAPTTVYRKCAPVMVYIITLTST